MEPAQLVVLPGDIVFAGDLAQGIQVSFAAGRHIDLVTILVAAYAQHLHAKPLEGVGVRRTVVVVGLIPVHVVEGLKAVTAVGGGVDLFCGALFQVSDGDLMFPKVFQIPEIHLLDFLHRHIPVLGGKGVRASRSVGGLYCYRSLLLRCQLQKGFCCQVVQYISCFKHLVVITVNFFRRVDPLVAEIVGHLHPQIVDFGDVKYHTAVPHFLGNVPVGMGFAAGAFPPSGAAVEISSVLIVSCFMAEGKEGIIAGAQSCVYHPIDHIAVSGGGAAIFGADGVVGFIDPFHHRISGFVFVLVSCVSSVALREVQPGVVLDVHEAVEHFNRIFHPGGGHTVKNSHFLSVYLNDLFHPLPFQSVFYQIGGVAVHAADH